MKNKIIILVLTFFAVVESCYAAVQMKVTSINEFDTLRPSKMFDVRVSEDVVLGSYVLKAGDILKNNVVQVTNPKRGKRDAVFYVQPYAYVSSGNVVQISDKIYGKYSKTVLSMEEIKNMPKGEVIEKAAVTVGNFYVKGLKQGVSLVKGVVKNEDGNRLQSGVKQVYEDSLFSYVEKGHDLDVKPNEQFYLIFKIEDDDEPNYSYTEAK